MIESIFEKQINLFSNNAYFVSFRHIYAGYVSFKICQNDSIVVASSELYKHR